MRGTDIQQDALFSSVNPGDRVPGHHPLRPIRTIKYEEVYLKAYRTVTEARHSIGDYVTLYNQRRPHSSLDGVSPDTFYYQLLPQQMAA